ncbi:MAG: hypothetical protein M0R50_09905 [Candidatus Cloacimonetes bacterium]|nr:hypothetical protein [Candidatus Cloacimonadota bacterium]
MDQEDDIQSEIDKMIERMDKTDPLVNRIKAEHKKKDWAGIEVCPICGGKLHLTHAAYNGHVSGSCETADCLNWME